MRPGSDWGRLGETERRNPLPTANLNGVDIFYRSTGWGGRIVPTHGAWTDSDTWQGVTPLLGDRHQVVTWDRRGHRRSGGREAPGSWHEDAAHLAALIDHLGGEPVHSVDNSSGGSVVLNVVAARPDPVVSASAHEPATFALLEGSADAKIARDLEEGVRRSERVRRLLERGENREAARFFIDEVAVGHGSWKMLPSETREVLVANAGTFLGEIDHPSEPGSLDVEGLRQTSVPILFTYGTARPPLGEPSTRELGAVVPSASCRAVEGSGHLPHRTHPDTGAAPRRLDQRAERGVRCNPVISEWPRSTGSTRAAWQLRSFSTRSGRSLGPRGDAGLAEVDHG